MPAAICPCCKRPMPTAKGVNRKYIRDRERCLYAIGVLERFDGHKFCSHDRESVKRCLESIHEELARMQRAYNDPALLWAIFRRADKGESYRDMPAVAPARTIRRKRVAA